MSHDFERDRANGDLDLLEGWRAQNAEDRQKAFRVWAVIWFLVACFWAGVYFLVRRWVES